MTHPADSVPMPEPVNKAAQGKGGWGMVTFGPLYTADQLRSYGLSAYEMGRNAGLEEAVYVCEQEVKPTYSNDMNVTSASQAAEIIKGIQR